MTQWICAHCGGNHPSQLCPAAAQTEEGEKEEKVEKEEEKREEKDKDKDKGSKKK